MSSELPWDVEFESTYMPTTPRSESVAPHPIVNPLTHVCWPAYRIGNQILDELNLAETECLENRIIWTGTQRQLSKVEEEDMMVCWQSVTPMVKVRDLGVFIDRELTMEAHVSNTVRGCRYQLRRVARSLTLDSQRALATAFVASRIVCNSVLYGVAKGEVQRLQMVLNAAARLVVGTGKFSQVTPILCDVLHWLSVQHRISYKIAILARDCIHGIGPAYFGDVCTPVTAAPGRTNLRSATCGDLVIPRTRTKLLLINHFLVPLTAVTSGKKKNWANSVSIYPHRRCGTHSRLQAANISEKN